MPKHRLRSRRVSITWYNYLNNSETTDAIVAFNNAIAADSTIKLGVLGALAYSYALNGQSSQAIASYQELISLLQQQKPTQSSTQYTNTMKAIQSYKMQFKRCSRAAAYETNHYLSILDGYF